MTSTRVHSVRSPQLPLRRYIDKQTKHIHVDDKAAMDGALWTDKERKLKREGGRVREGDIRGVKNQTVIDSHGYTLYKS